MNSEIEKQKCVNLAKAFVLLNLFLRFSQTSGMKTQADFCLFPTLFSAVPRDPPKTQS